MKTRSILMTMALCCFALAASAADNPNMGTWKLNDSKSQIAAGMMKNSMVVYTAAGDNVKVTSDGTTGDGKPLHTEWVGKFDGKDYPLTGDSSADTRAYTQVDDHTLTIESKKDGKAVNSAKIVVSPDGKSRTVSVMGKDSTGKEITGTSVYDKQ